MFSMMSTVKPGSVVRQQLRVRGAVSQLRRAHRLRNDLYCVEWDVKLYSLTPSDYRFDDPHVPDWCDPDSGSVSYTHSARNMPTEYFMFMESGPELYAQIDKRPFVGTFSALAMGFR